MKRKEILISGTGGQGIQLAGRIFAKALDNKGYLSTFHANYGPEARGGESFCEIVIKESPEDWPEVMQANWFAALSQPSYDGLKDRVKKSGKVIYDPVLVKPEKGKNLYPFPISEVSSEINGRINMVLLGIILAFTKLVTVESVCQVLKEEGKFSEANRRSLEEGYKLIKR